MIFFYANEAQIYSVKSNDLTWNFLCGTKIDWDLDLSISLCFPYYFLSWLFSAQLRI